MKTQSKTNLFAASFRDEIERRPSRGTAWQHDVRCLHIPKETWRQKKRCEIQTQQLSLNPKELAEFLTNSLLWFILSTQQQKKSAARAW